MLRAAAVSVSAACFVSALALNVFACGLTADFTGLQGGTPASPGGSSADASTDGAPSDTGTLDASVGFCASLAKPPRLCADFDEGGPVSTGWSLADVSAGQSVALSPVAYSAPSSFLSRVNTTDGQASSRLQQSVPITALRVHIEFRMLLAPSDGDYELCVLHQDSLEGVTYGVFYKLTDGKIVVYLRTRGGDGGITNLTHTLGAPTASWMHVEIDIEVSTPGSIVVKHDGAVVVNDVSVPVSTADRTKMYVDLGLYTFKPGSARANFDDVVVDYP